MNQRSVLEIPENFSNEESEPKNFRQAEKLSASPKKIPVELITESMSGLKMEYPTNEKENELSQECYAEAKKQYESLADEDQQLTSISTIAAQLFTTRVWVLRRQELTDVVAPVNAPTYPVEAEKAAEVIAAPTGSFIRKQVAPETKEISRTNFVSPVKTKIPKPKMTLREVFEELGLEGVDIVPSPPRCRMEFYEPGLLDVPKFVVPCHWIVLQADENGIDRFLVPVYDLRYKQQTLHIPPQLGTRGEAWTVRVYTDKLEYTCNVMDTRLFVDVAFFRQIILLVLSSS